MGSAEPFRVPPFTASNRGLLSPLVMDDCDSDCDCGGHNDPPVHPPCLGTHPVGGGACHSHSRAATITSRYAEEPGRLTLSLGMWVPGGRPNGPSSSASTGREPPLICRALVAK